MYQLLLLFFVQSFFVAAADDFRFRWNCHDRVDVFQMFGNYAFASNMPNCNVKYVTKLYHKLKIITAADKEFLSTEELKNWHATLDNVVKQIPLDDDEQSEKIKDDLQEEHYPITHFSTALAAIAWAKKLVKNGGWSPDWLRQFPLIRQKNSPILLSTEEVKTIRLKQLAATKMKLYEKLVSARHEAPETLPDFGTARISNLLYAWDCKHDFINWTTAEKTVIQFKTLAARLNVLMMMDFEWFSPRKQHMLKEMISENDDIAWKDERSRMFFRWQLKAIEWAQQNIDECENLNWINRVHFKQSGQLAQKYDTSVVIDISCLSAEELKKRRLAALSRLKTETELLLNNYEKRKQAYPNKKYIEDDGDCTIV